MTFIVQWEISKQHHTAEAANQAQAEQAVANHKARGAHHAVWFEIEEEAS